MFKLLVKAPKAFWTVGLVQFFCWAAFMFMWTYTNGTVALNVFDTPVITTMTNGVSRVVLIHNPHNTRQREIGSGSYLLSKPSVPLFGQRSSR